MITFPCWKKAYVIMGGGINSKNKLHDHVIERCNFFLDLPLEEKESTLVIASSCFSLNVRTKLGENGTPLSEASLICAYLRNNGYLDELLCEQQSHDTIGSVYFVLNNYLKVFDLPKVSFITSDFHQARVDLIAKHFNQILFDGYFDFEVLASKTKIPAKIRGLKERESCKSFEKKFGKITSAPMLLYYLYKNHTNYNCSFKSEAILSDENLY
jgi:hypothetical protein